MVTRSYFTDLQWWGSLMEIAEILQGATVVVVWLLSRFWLCDPVDCSPPGPSVHGILQARILEWVATPFSRGSSQPRDWTWVSRIVGKFFTIWATGEALEEHKTTL